MFGYKQCLALGALLVISFTVATSAQCKGCQGKTLIESVTTFEEQKNCWFNDRHHYLLKFKLQLLNSTTEQLAILIDSSNAKAPANCHTTYQIEKCLSTDSDTEANCQILNMKSLVKIYDDLEQCSGEALDVNQLELVYNFMVGQVVGWKQLHDTC